MTKYRNQHLGICLLVLMLAGIALPDRGSKNPVSDYLDCKANIWNMAEALGWYNSTHHRYPSILLDALKGLDPSVESVEQVMVCPASGRATYIYEVSEDGDYYRIYCKGENHVEAGELVDTPSYDSTSGMAPNKS